MNEEKRFGNDQEEEKENTEQTENTSSPAGPKGNMTSRARNRTVMLSPEMTGQVRAMLYKGGDSGNDSNSADSWTKPDLNKQNPVFSQPKSEPIILAEEPGAVVEKKAPAYENPYSQEGQFNIKAGGPQPTGKMDPSFLNKVITNTAAYDMKNRKEVSPAPAQQTMPTPPQQSQSIPVVNYSQLNKATQAKPVVEVKKATPTSKLVGFMVSFDGNEFGEVFEIRAGRWLITSRQTDQGEYILINDPTVSPLHAVIRATKEGKMQVLDQLSEHGTAVMKNGSNEEVEVAGSMIGVEHGDMVRFGNRYFVICTVPEYKKPG